MLKKIKSLSSKNGRGYGLYMCECGNTKDILNTSVNTGHTKSCGCKSKDVIKKGKRYFKLIVLKEEATVKGNRYFKCKCDCGTETVVQLNHLKNGHTKSCGCLQGNIIHGMSNTDIYKRYYGIKQRCDNPNYSRYKDYGGRGIKCQWKTFEEFYNDMGSSFKKNLTIDRIDNNGHYCKSNCRLVTSKENSRNTRSNIYYYGKTLIEWCEIFEISYSKMYTRKRRGKDIESEIYDLIEEYGSTCCNATIKNGLCMDCKENNAGLTPEE